MLAVTSEHDYSDYVMSSTIISTISKLPIMLELMGLI